MPHWATSPPETDHARGHVARSWHCCWSLPVEIWLKPLEFGFDLCLNVGILSPRLWKTQSDERNTGNDSEADGTKQVATCLEAAVPGTSRFDHSSFHGSGSDRDDGDSTNCNGRCSTCRRCCRQIAGRDSTYPETSLDGRRRGWFRRLSGRGISYEPSERKCFRHRCCNDFNGEFN